MQAGALAQKLGGLAIVRRGLRGGIVAVDGGARHVALGQAHDLPALQVDRGKDDEGQGFHSRKRRSSSMP